MKLKELFEKVNILNNILNDLGVEKVYGIKMIAQEHLYDFECLHQVYTDINQLIKNFDDETYITSIEEHEVELTQIGDTLEESVWDLYVFVTDAFNNKEKATFYCILEEVDID